MAGGRPPKDGGPKRYPELEELAAWFRQAMADAGYENPNAVVRAEIAHKNVVYGIHGASRFLKLDVVRALAVGLRRDPAEVEPLWIKAKEAVDRAAAARHAAEMPHLTSWAQTPLPELALRNLMEAQSRAVERLPYDKLGVEEPPLSAVYIRQRIRASARNGDGAVRGDTGSNGEGAQRMAEPGRGDNAQVLESLLPVPDALARHEHLLITAEPGAGKSTLSSHVAWTLSRIWLRQDSSLDAPVSEPVIPIRVAARTLVDQSGSWSAVLCQAARRSLGRSLVADPDPALFAGRVQGARWLVMVDGLDEIADRDARTGVIRTIAQHARAGSDYRFLVTSRPLPESELAPLRGSLIGAYGMEPFGASELRDFAGKWFAAQYEDDKERARAAADRFLNETEDGRLHDLVRNPLLATIAAVSATVDRSRPLPTSRLSLYQRFCEHLFTRGASASTVRTELNRRYRDDPERRAFHLWLDQHKREVLGALGRCRIEGEGSLSEAALTWVREHTAEERRLPAGWHAEVREFLQGTGLLVPEEKDYRFLHHSFAEFMAAQAYALEIPPDFPEAEDWIRRAFKGDERTLAMFVFCMWSERAGCGADRIADQLMLGTRGGHERSLLAGLLLAEGVPIGEANRALILDRLEAIARNAEDEDLEKAFEVLGALGGQSGVLQRLERIARSQMLDPMLRLYAVEAYSQAGDADVAERLLGPVLGWIYGGIPRAAQVACSIGEGARDAVRRRAWALVEGPEANVFLLAFVATALERLGPPQEAAETARKVLEDPQAQTADLERAAEAWLKALPSDAAAVAHLALERPAADQRGRAAVAKVLEELGEPEAAARIAGEVLGSGTSDATALTSAARTWAKVRGAEGRAEVMAAFAGSSADLGHDVDTPAALLSSVAVFSEGTEIADWAQDVLGEHRWGALFGGKVVSAWLAAEGAAAAEAVMERIGRGHLLEGYARAESAEAMLEAGARPEAGELAECALRTPNLSRGRYKQSADVLFKVHSDDAADRLQGIWAEGSGLDISGAWLHGVLDAYSEQEVEAPLMSVAVGRFARELIGLGTANSADVILALDNLSEVESRDAVPYIVETATTHPRLSWAHRCDIAKGLAALGERAAALEVWRHMVSRPYPPQHVELRLLMDIEAAEATEEATGWIRELIADPGTYPPRRLRLRQILAWLTAAEPRSTRDPAESVADAASATSP
ncbi:NACHT domain-containing protein [Streptomyces sp. NPDC007264]|uniref:NACHT domain-containing protein n=1 Tax=Streptomyces sp. NPDC007264 TaxID=3364777 RepID=UPI0036DF854C